MLGSDESEFRESHSLEQAQFTAELRAWVEAEALKLGFHVAGVAAAEGPTAELAGERFAEWVAEGRMAEMAFLGRRNSDGTLLRSDLRVGVPGARSIIVCGLSYNADAPFSIDADLTGELSHQRGWIARYAWSGRRVEAEDRSESPLVGSDYHAELLTRLRAIETGLKQRARGCRTWSYVDTGPIVERSFAAAAGVGWIGKNTCVLNERLGSWLLLGVIVTSLPIAVEASWLPSVGAIDRCGSCTRCIDACPTDALIAPRQMDAARCIAYLTIEKKGPIDEELRPLIGRQVFGCDICQEVCPWNGPKNHVRSLAHTPGMELRPELVNPSLEWLASLDKAGFAREFGGSPLERTKLRRLHRNVAVAMGNSGNHEFIGRLEQWAVEEDVVLAEAARWALDQLRP